MTALGFHMPRVRPTPGCRYVVARAFDWHGGRRLVEGEAFPADVHEGTAYQLWQGGFLTVSPAPPLPLAAPAVSPPVTVQRAEEPALRRRR
jgi:hypothetical protein